MLLIFLQVFQAFMLFPSAIKVIIFSFRVIFK